MKKIVNSNISKTIMVPILIFFIWITAGSASAVSRHEDNPPAKTAKEKDRHYTYTLSPEKTGTPGEDYYTRREIESFLCAAVENYIGAEEVYKEVHTGRHFVKAKAVVENQKKTAENHEISRWFEDNVTVTSRGNLTIVDIDTLKRFFKKINDIIGQEKFIYKPGLDAANIVVEVARPGKSGIRPKNADTKNERYMGEASLLEDNMKVRLSIDNNDIHMETYQAGTGSFILTSRQIEMTAGEMAFRKNNRIVKIYLQNILDPTVRRRSIVHELFHSIGFTGHSPYFDSNLFPLPVKTYEGTLPHGQTKAPIIAPLAEVMVEMLYRPEILPGMTIKQAAEVLPHLKRKNKTAKQDIISYLLKRREILEEKKKELLDLGKKNYDQKMNLLIELDKLVRKEKNFLEELAEIKADTQQDPGVVTEIREAKSLVAKFSRIRKEIILLENKKKKLSAQSVTGEDARETAKHIENWGEEIVVLKDILAAAQEVAAMERKIGHPLSLPGKVKIEKQLRRIVRQLLCVEKELSGLEGREGRVNKLED